MLTCAEKILLLYTEKEEIGKVIFCLRFEKNRKANLRLPVAVHGDAPSYGALTSLKLVKTHRPSTH